MGVSHSWNSKVTIIKKKKQTKKETTIIYLEGYVFLVCINSNDVKIVNLSPFLKGLYK